MAAPSGPSPMLIGASPGNKPEANQPWNYFQSIPTYAITVPKRHRQTDGRTDDIQWHNRTLRSVAR